MHNESLAELIQDQTSSSMLSDLHIHCNKACVRLPLAP